MTTSRLAILLALILGGLGLVHTLPSRPDVLPPGIELTLPEYLGEWWGTDVSVSEAEHEILGHETEFARKVYDNGLGARILVSVVLGGQDMMTSIHRPELCLRAQGWEFGIPQGRTLNMKEKGGLKVTRVLNSKTLRREDGATQTASNLCYYWFAGAKELTPSHMERVLIDSRERLFNGQAQRWALVMVSSEITEGHQKFGRDEKATDQLLSNFVTKLAPILHKPELR